MYHGPISDVIEYVYLLVMELDDLSSGGIYHFILFNIAIHDVAKYYAE